MPNFDSRKHMIYGKQETVLPAMLLQMQSSSSHKALHQLDKLPFTGFPEIARLNISKYGSGFKLLFSKYVQADCELEEAVNTLLLNLFVNSPANVVREGKQDYNYPEREYTRRQLLEYLRTIPCIEVFFSDAPPMIGNFRGKQTCSVDKMLYAKPSLKEEYHLAYIDDNHRDSFARAVKRRKEQVLEDLLNNKYGPQIEAVHNEIISLAKGMGEKGLDEYDALDKRLAGILPKDIFTDRTKGGQQILEAIRILQSGQPQGPFDEKAAQLLKITHHCFLLEQESSPELEAEIRKIPGYEQIIQGVASSLAPKGVLILNPAQDRAFQGLKYLGSFGKVGMYQKVPQT